jgi:SAM-dependent methyltransferase
MDTSATSSPVHTPKHEVDGRRACRSCAAPLDRIVLDLGMSPFSEDFLLPDRLHQAETFYPLDVRICESCLLVQLPVYRSAEEIFGEYGYFSSYSESWVEHAREYVEAICARFDLGPTSRVIEIASNDGYLLRHLFARGIRALGVEPARNIAAVAISRGIPTIAEFFSQALAEQLLRDGSADLLIANNVFAHVPDLNDFTAGLRSLLAPGGVLTIEVAYLVRLIEGNQFDTIYHEHLMYYTLTSVERVLARHGLRVFDVETLSTHGGSLRLFVVHDADPRPTGERVEALRQAEEEAGYRSLEGYGGWKRRLEILKWDLLQALVENRRKGAVVVGYGAPGKGNTLLNYCGIRTDLVDFLVDRNPYKHGRFTPGTHIPIFPIAKLEDARPDVILLLPWNLRNEILEQLRFVRKWGARVIIPIPKLEVVTP